MIGRILLWAFVGLNVLGVLWMMFYFRKVAKDNDIRRTMAEMLNKNYHDLPHHRQRDNDFLSLHQERVKQRVTYAALRVQNEFRRRRWYWSIWIFGSPAIRTFHRYVIAANKYGFGPYSEDIRDY